MSKLSRRAFIGSTALGAGALATSSCSSAKPGAESRNSPLDGIARENIKITDVKMTILSHEFAEEHQWFVAGRYAWKTDTMILQIFTDQGIVGIGEGSPYGYLDKMREYTEKYVKPVLVGQNPFDVDLLTCGVNNPWGGRGSTAYLNNRTICCAWAGANNALWDIIGKAKNLPVYKLLATDNEPDTHIRLYASGGVEYTWYDSGRPTLPEVIEGYKENGYTASKFRIGTDWEVAGMTVQKYIPWLEKVREAVGPDFDLCQEHNMRLTLEQCKEICPTYERLKFHWLEEPFNRYEEGAVEGHIELCELLPTVMVTGGEGMHNRMEFKEFVDRDAYDIVQPDCNILGISEAWAIARMAHLKGKLCCPHNWHGG
ncbi:MAG: mandelate racemase/muconate lactonizing enzyme family protein, partial [Verrucomicrobia bacterium]|nr:mandelate racemase/muconate lactonizing enzyme family protein [Verrucomicrobiota bacterium]